MPARSSFAKASAVAKAMADRVTAPYRRGCRWTPQRERPYQFEGRSRMSEVGKRTRRAPVLRKKATEGRRIRLREGFPRTPRRERPYQGLSGLPNEPSWSSGNPSRWNISGRRRLLVATGAAVSVGGIRGLRQLSEDLDELG